MINCFVCSRFVSHQMGSIKQLEPRLKHISFKMKFNELVQDIRPHLVAATAAMEEVRKSKSFAKVIQIILKVSISKVNNRVSELIRSSVFLCLIRSPTT